jgi:uncharacterized protein YegP (UPF0339 family)
MTRSPALALTRRSFTRLSMMTVVAGIFGLSVAAPAHASEKLKFELYADKAGEFRWRLKAGNGETLATSGQGYKNKADAKNGIERIKADADKLTFETYEDAKREYRWRLKAKNGQIIGASSEGYKAKADADHAVTLIKDGAKDATVTDETKS